ncbi:hypothetical protein VFPBJ_05340 [Purpureocillium lilacinum]|uniref:Uncharacterized protein n=1 Tax=Purpureocillium lilacinum TaxID=33203 RepID=A0A179GPD1_PURLI|nr:hypothetical protein VFPBJ_05340 [Purpureocillium lilacinum]
MSAATTTRRHEGALADPPPLRQPLKRVVRAGLHVCARRWLRHLGSGSPRAMTLAETGLTELHVIGSRGRVRDASYYPADRTSTRHDEPTSW